MARTPLVPDLQRRMAEIQADPVASGYPLGIRQSAASRPASDYAAIVDRASFAPQVIPLGTRPYWATTRGDHPQRVRMGVIRRSYLKTRSWARGRRR